MDPRRHETVPQKTAAILVIGDELLSGRTRDANTFFLAGMLSGRGIRLCESRTVGDSMEAIAAALNALRVQYDYLFTSGGIGPTHDDITMDAVAAALGRKVIQHPLAVTMIRKWYDARREETTQARLRMARMPEGAGIICNPVSGAPGARIENIFIMAGVPRIFRGMLDGIADDLGYGPVIHSRAVTADSMPESELADCLRDIQNGHADVTLGSYPRDGAGKGVTVIARSRNLRSAEAVIDMVHDAIRHRGHTAVRRDTKTRQ